MAEIRSLGAIKDKWTRVTPGRTEDYKIGIANPRRDWAEETKAAEGNYKAGVDAAHAKGLFLKGVEKAGSAKWKEKSLKKGPGRFAEGVYIAGPDYEKGFAPYHAAIERVDLGPRFPKRDPRNLDRVKRIVDAMITEKVG
ncbi:hypothetical protein ES703_37878 [subsurface metagenome]